MKTEILDMGIEEPEEIIKIKDICIDLPPEEIEERVENQIQIELKIIICLGAVILNILLLIT